MPDTITLGSALVSVAAAAISVWQARYAKRQAVAAEEQVAALKEQVALLKVQADLAKAQHDQLKLAKDEEQAHRDWVDKALAELHKPGRELVLVTPGDHLHAEWALVRGLVNSLETARGMAIILPAAERSPGSYEAKVRAMRQTILTECSARPGTWHNSEAQGAPPEEWQVYLSVAQELDREGLVTAKTSSDRYAVAIRITPQGSEAARRGTF
jgi:hypothetical protein